MPSVPTQVDYIGDKVDKEAGGDSGKSRNPGHCSGRRAGGLDSDPLMPEFPGHGTMRFAVMVADHVSPTSPPSLPTLEFPGKDLEDWDPGLYEAAKHGMLPDGSDINQCHKFSHLEHLYAVTDETNSAVYEAMDDLGLRPDRQPVKVMEPVKLIAAVVRPWREKLGGKGTRCGSHNGSDLIKEFDVMMAFSMRRNQTSFGFRFRADQICPYRS